MIGKIERVGLREVWKHEALDFTTWLEENIDVLNDALDLTIVTADREQAAGNFSVDIVGEDSDGKNVRLMSKIYFIYHETKKLS